MRIALAGSGCLSMALLRALRPSRHELVAVVQNGRRTRGIGRAWRAALGGVFARESSEVGIARSHGLPIIWLDRMDDAELAPLRAAEPDVLLVGGFGVILKRPVLALPRVGCVNTHSSLLPRHRGPHPCRAAILENEAETGVTFHVMDEGIDTGPILAQHRVPIEPDDTAVTLQQRVANVAAEHVAELMDRIEREGLRGRPQSGEASYEPMPKPADAAIDWSAPAGDIDRLVRANLPVPMARFRHRGRTVYVTHVTLSRGDPSKAPGTVLARRPVRVAAGDGAIELVTAYVGRPVPWVWPNPWDAPRTGEVLE